MQWLTGETLGAPRGEIRHGKLAEQVVGCRRSLIVHGDASRVAGAAGRPGRTRPSVAVMDGKVTDRTG